MRSKIPERTIKGNKDGIILVHQVVSADKTRRELLTGLVNNKNIKRMLVSKDRLFKNMDFLDRKASINYSIHVIRIYCIIRNRKWLKNCVETIRQIFM